MSIKRYCDLCGQVTAHSMTETRNEFAELAQKKLSFIFLVTIGDTWQGGCWQDILGRGELCPKCFWQALIRLAKRHLMILNAVKKEEAGGSQGYA